jgi:prophage regulatory protein
MVKKMKRKVSILRRPKVQERTGLSRSTIYDLMRKGLFPKPIALGPRSKGWVSSEITSWIEERIRNRDAEAQCNAQG